MIIESGNKQIPINLKQYNTERDPGGAEKATYKVQTLEGTVCIKLVRERNDSDGKKQNRQQMAVTELTTYRLLGKALQHQFVPREIGLVKDGRKIVGLAVSWIEGFILSDRPHNKLVSGTEVDRLQRSLYVLASAKIFINRDMIGESNLMLAVNGTLWFAECRLVRSMHYVLNPNDYIHDVGLDMDYLRSEYVGR